MVLETKTGTFFDASQLSPEFLFPVISYDVLQAPTPVVAPNGDVYVCWIDISQYGIQGSPGTVKLKKSTNGGQSFGSTITVASTFTVWKYGISSFYPSTIPTIAIDQSNGFIYVAYTQYDRGYLNIYYTRSTDGGISWNTPSVATSSTTNHQFMPFLSIGSTGIISLFYCEGSSNTCDYYITQSHNNGLSFSTPHYRVTNQSSIPLNAKNASFHGGDYIGISQLDADNIYPVWFDFRSGVGSEIIGSKVNPPPSIPSGFTITGSFGDHPTLHWNANSEIDLNGYKIYQKMEVGDEYLLFTVNKYSTSFTDNGILITNGKFDPRIYYRISAFDLGNNESEKTNSLCIISNYINKELVVVGKVLIDYLYPSYPNPFNNETKIRYCVSKDSNVNISIYDPLGRLIDNIENKYKIAGEYEIYYSTAKLPSGIYSYTITTPTFRKSRKFIVNK